MQFDFILTTKRSFMLNQYVVYVNNLLLVNELLINWLPVRALERMHEPLITLLSGTRDT